MFCIVQIVEIASLNRKKNDNLALNRVEPSRARATRVLCRAELEFEILSSIEFESSFELEYWCRVRVRAW